MSGKDWAPALLAGALSAVIFLFVFALSLPFIFLFLPTLPLFTLGLSPRRHSSTLYAALIAAIIAALAAGPAVGVTYILFLGFPSYWLSRRSLMWRDGASVREWFPIGRAFIELTLYAGGLIALLTVFYMSQSDSLPKMLAENIHDAFADAGEEYGEIVDQLANRWAFLVVSVAVWLWGLALYAHGWIAERALIKKGAQLRPDFAAHRFHMPSWMLWLLGICALASLIGGESISFLGKACLIAFMLPYFFLGAAILHEASKTWPSRRFILFFIYFLMLAQFWPALGLSLLGLWAQIKGLSAAGTSSKR